jgi:hypothetical protein
VTAPKAPDKRIQQETDPQRQQAQRNDSKIEPSLTDAKDTEMNNDTHCPGVLKDLGIPRNEYQALSHRVASSVGRGRGGEPLPEVREQMNTFIPEPGEPTDINGQGNVVR